MDSLIVSNINTHQEDTDALTWVAKFIGRPEKVLSDRFGYLNRFSRWNFDTELKPIPQPVYSGTLQEFETILDEELSRIEKQRKPLYMLYSGGVDSSCLLSAMLMRGMDDICLLYSDLAESENPSLFKKLQQYRNVRMCPLTSETVVSLSAQALCSGLLITGTCGDKLFNADFHNTRIYEEDSHWQNLLARYKVKNLVQEQIRRAITSYDIHVKTEAELLFWLSYSCVWYWGMPNLMLCSLPNSENHVKPFASEKMQQWAISRLPGIRDVFSADPANYKVEMKAIIERLTHDHDYTLYKNKEHSMRALRKGASFGMFAMDSSGTKRLQDISELEVYRLR